MCDIYPFTDNIEYLDHLIEWLRCRARRILQERDGGKPDIFPVPRAPQPDDWDIKERQLRDSIDERLAVHQADPDATVLGLELLRSEHRLNDDEVLVLVACTVVAISSNLASEVMAELCGAPYGIQVEDLLALLDPCCSPHGLEQLLTFRAYFRPETSKLIQAGLISVDGKDDTPPADLLGDWVQVTSAGFKAVTGFPA